MKKIKYKAGMHFVLRTGRFYDEAQVLRCKVLSVTKCTVFEDTDVVKLLVWDRSRHLTYVYSVGTEFDSKGVLETSDILRGYDSSGNKEHPDYFMREEIESYDWNSLTDFYLV